MISGGNIKGIAQKLCNDYAGEEKLECLKLSVDAWRDGCENDADQEACVDSYIQSEMKPAVAKPATSPSGSAPRRAEVIEGCDPKLQSCGPKEVVAAVAPAAPAAGAAPAAAAAPAPKPAAPKPAAARTTAGTAPVAAAVASAAPATRGAVSAPPPPLAPAPEPAPVAGAAAVPPASPVVPLPPAVPGAAPAAAPTAGATPTAGAAGDLPIEVAEYNSDGLRQTSPFLREAEGAADYLPHGSVTANMEPSSETFGFFTAAEAEGRIVTNPDFAVGYGLAAMLWQWPNLAALYSGDSALRKGWYPKGTEDPDGLWSDFQFYVYFEKPLGGRYGIALPEVNLVGANEKALEIEKRSEGRWGKEAAAVYLDSVLRKQMAHATADTKDFEARWNLAVTNGAKKYEEMLNSGSLPSADATSPDSLATQIQLADLFQYNPMGLVDFIAVWSGKTPEEIKEKLSNVDWPKVHENKAADRVSNIRSILAFAGAAGLSKEYKFPEKQGEEKPEVTPLPDSSDIRANYKRKMNEVLGQIAEASGMKMDDMKKEAKDKGLDLDTTPPNPWAAQRVVDALIDTVAKKKYGDKAPVKLRMDLGNVDRLHDYAGFGVKLSVKWNPVDVLELGGWVFAGAARSNPIDTTSDGPSFAFMDIKDKSDDGATVAGGLTGKWTIYKTEQQGVRELGLQARLYYTGAGDEGTPSEEAHLGWMIGPNATFVPFRGTNFTTEHSFHYEGRVKFTPSGDVVRHFIVASPLKARFGDHFYVRPADYVYQNGTRGGGDFAERTTNDPWGGPANGTTPPSSIERTLEVGQTGHFLKGVIGWEFETDKFMEFGYSYLLYNDLTKINEERINNGSLDRLTVSLGVKVPF